MTSLRKSARIGACLHTKPVAHSSSSFLARGNASFHHPQYMNQGFSIPRRKRVIVGITGATGSPLALELLRRLRQLNVETHLVLSTWGAATLKYEAEAPYNTTRYLHTLADHIYSHKDMSASISSGSFLTDGMIVVPCSMKTLAGIRMGYDADLISRAAGVAFKDRRKLVLVARETPLSSIHLENMLAVSQAGAVIFPPVMTFYNRPGTIQDMVKQSVTRMVDALDLGIEEHAAVQGRWEGFQWEQKKKDERKKCETEDAEAASPFFRG